MSDRKEIARNFAWAYLVVKAIVVSLCLFFAFQSWKANDDHRALGDLIHGVWFTISTLLVYRFGKFNEVIQ